MATKVFRIPELISKKANGKHFSDEEIAFLVNSIVEGRQKIEDAQIGAMLMAIRLKGMDEYETVALTKCMMGSGETLQWPEEWVKDKIVVDKHSTGGVGDKISLVLAPALATFGLKVPMISGRGLGHTGGTLDKLEALPGYTVQQSSESIRKILEDVGCCIVGQTKSMVPADRIIYGIRDVTATVESVPLIVASILSKKASESLNALVLDVKYGQGAMYKNKDEAEHLALEMVKVGNGLGIQTVAVMTNMNHPIGKNVGNALEVREAILSLQGKGPDSTMELVKNLGAHLLVSCGKYDSVKQGQAAIEQCIENGQALEKFKQMIISQGVSTEDAEKVCQNVEESNILPQASIISNIVCEEDGFVSNIDPLMCAETCKSHGAGRNKASDILDLSVGLEFKVVVGDAVKKGDVLVKFHHNGKKEEQELENDLRTLKNAITINSTKPAVSSLINNIFSAETLNNNTFEM